CGGVAALFRYDVGLAIFGLECALVAFSAWLHTRSKRTIAGNVALFACGFFCVIAPVAIVFAMAGVIPDFLFDVVQYPSHFYVKMRSLPFPLRWALENDPESLVVYLPLLAVCASAFICFKSQRFIVGRWGAGLRRSPHLGDWMLLTLTGFALVF